jgi:hypothetical protein
MAVIAFSKFYNRLSVKNLEKEVEAEFNSVQFLLVNWG